MTTTIEKIDIRSDDGVSSRITVYRGAAPESAVVIIMPAMGVPATFYKPLVRAFVDQGLNAVTADLRGHGESSVRPGRGVDYGYGEMVLYDWPCIVDRVESLFPRSQKFILGHSLGGQLTPPYLADNPCRIEGLIMVAAPSLYWLDWPFPRSVAMLFATVVFPLVARILGSFPGRRVGVGGRESMGLMRDWGRIVRRGRYDMISPGEDYVAGVRELETPLLAISFTDDGFAPERAVDRYCRRMPGASITRWHIAPSELGCDALGHIHWVRQSDALAARIVSWLRASEGYPRCRM